MPIMPRYILRYQHAVQAPEPDLKKIRAALDLKVVDESPRMVLVDGDEEAAKASLLGLFGWTVTPETSTPLPSTRAKIR